MEAIIFVVLYTGIMILPAYAISRVLPREVSTLPITIGLSYALFSLVFVSCNYISASASQLRIAMLIIIAISVGTIAATRNRAAASGFTYARPVLLIVIASTLYQLVFGSYIEVPADLYAHMERYQFALGNIRNDSLGMAWSVRQLFLQSSGVFYYFVANIADISGAPTTTVVQLVDWINRTIFLLATFFFARGIYGHRSKPDAVAYTTTLFVFLHMGISVFSYVRYYSLAPTILNYVLYLAAVTLFINLLCTKTEKLQSSIFFLLISVLAAASATIHVQESMFIVVMISVISLTVLTLRWLVRFNNSFQLSIHTAPATLVVLLGFGAFVAAYLYSHYHLPRAANAHWRLWEFSQSFGLLPKISTLNLKNQFIQVVTLWGSLVYLLFFLNIKRYTTNLFILAGMFSPIFTILNPFFVDLFLRHYNSTTLWRLTYLIPIHYVAADLFVHYINLLKTNRGLRMVFPVSVMFALVALLLPWKNTWQGFHYSRFPTLGASEPALSYSHYDDLLNYLQAQDTSYDVLTDPMTGYMVSAMTKHTSRRRKFFRDYRFRAFTFEDYSNNPLRKYRGYLLIVNKREHPLSDVATLSGHWRSNEWQEKHHYYSEALTTHIEESGVKAYQPLWDNNGVSVYLIK